MPNHRLGYNGPELFTIKNNLLSCKKLDKILPPNSITRCNSNAHYLFMKENQNPPEPKPIPPPEPPPEPVPNNLADENRKFQAAVAIEPKSLEITRENIPKRVHDMARLTNASYMKSAGVSNADIRKTIPDLIDKYGEILPESTKKLLAFKNESTGDITVALKGTDSYVRGEAEAIKYWPRIIGGLQHGRSDRMTELRKQLSDIMRIHNNNNPIQNGTGHSLGAKAAIILANEGLIEKIDVFDPFGRASQIETKGEINIWTTPDAPGIIQKAALSRDTKIFIETITKGKDNVKVNIVPNKVTLPVKIPVINAVLSHSLNNFLKAKIEGGERTILDEYPAIEKQSNRYQSMHEEIEMTAPVDLDSPYPTDTPPVEPPRIPYSVNITQDGEAIEMTTPPGDTPPFESHPVDTPPVKPPISLGGSSLVDIEMTEFVTPVRTVRRSKRNAPGPLHRDATDPKGIWHGVPSRNARVNYTPEGFTRGGASSSNDAGASKTPVHNTNTREIEMPYVGGQRIPPSRGGASSSNDTGAGAIPSDPPQIVIQKTLPLADVDAVGPDGRIIFERTQGDTGYTNNSFENPPAEYDTHPEEVNFIDNSDPRQPLNRQVNFDEPLDFQPDYNDTPTHFTEGTSAITKAKGYAKGSVYGLVSGYLAGKTVDWIRPNGYHQEKLLETSVVNTIFLAGVSPITETLVPMIAAYEAGDLTDQFLNSVLPTNMEDHSRATLIGAGAGGASGLAFGGVLKFMRGASATLKTVRAGSFAVSAGEGFANPYTDALLVGSTIAGTVLGGGISLVESFTKPEERSDTPPGSRSSSPRTMRNRAIEARRHQLQSLLDNIDDDEEFKNLKENGNISGVNKRIREIIVEKRNQPLAAEEEYNPIYNDIIYNGGIYPEWTADGTWVSKQWPSTRTLEQLEERLQTLLAKYKLEGVQTTLTDQEEQEIYELYQEHIKTENRLARRRERRRERIERKVLEEEQDEQTSTEHTQAWWDQQLDNMEQELADISAHISAHTSTP